MTKITLDQLVESRNALHAPPQRPAIHPACLGSIFFECSSPPTDAPQKLIANKYCTHCHDQWWSLFYMKSKREKKLIKKNLVDRVVYRRDYGLKDIHQKKLCLLSLIAFMAIR